MAGTYKGVIQDRDSKEPIPFAAILIENESKGAIADEEGNFTIVVSETSAHQQTIKVSSIGYDDKVVILNQKNRVLKIELQQEAKQLNEVVITNKKYRNKGNPAVDLIKKVIENKKNNRSEAIDYYQIKKYEKVLFALDDITPEFRSKKIFKQFQFVFENTDTTKLKGKEILPIYLKESSSDIFYRKDPQKMKEVVRGENMVMINKYVDNQGISEFIQYLYEDVDVYQNNITFLTNQFLSPIAPVAPSFYRYYITDTLLVDGEKCVNLFFAARNKEDMLFTGNMYITLDGSYALKKIDFTLDKNVNLNWLRNVHITQEFQKTPDKGCILESYRTDMDFGVAKSMQGIFAQKQVIYGEPDFSVLPDSVFEGLSLVREDSVIEMDSAFWQENRLEPLSKSEAGTYEVMDKVQDVPVFKNSLEIAALLIQGYHDVGKYEIGPVSTFISYNSIEGYRLRFGGRTTPKLNKRFIFDSYLAYGTLDEQFKYSLAGTYSLTNRSIYEFPVKYVKLSYTDDTKTPGQELDYMQVNNVFLSFKRGVDDKIFYNKTVQLEYQNEFENHFSYQLGYTNTLQAPGGNLCFSYSDYASGINDVNQLNISELYLNLRFAPYEKIYQGKQFRTTINSTYPIFQLKYTLGADYLGNDYNYQKLQFVVSKRFYLSVFGYSDVQLEAAKMFGTVPYPLLFMPRANQTFSYQPLNYNLMNFLEFVSDEYSALLIDHCFNGFFLNKVPLVQKLGLREVMSLKLMYGGLSDKNNPSKNDALFKLPTESDGTPTAFIFGTKPYAEGSVGLSNIFKFFRVDFVYRFTYQDNSNVSPMGVRMRMKFDF